MRATLAALLVLAAWRGGPGGMAARAQEIVAPPAIYPADTWQGRSVATVRVLDTLDSSVQVLTIPVGQDATFRALTIHVGACRDRPATLTPDAAGWLAVRDTRQDGPGFNGWMLAGEPFLGVFQDPIYAVRLIGCAGDPVAPIPPPLAGLAAAATQPGDQPVAGAPGQNTPPVPGAPGPQVPTVPAAPPTGQPAAASAPPAAAPAARFGGAPLSLSPPDEDAPVPGAARQPSGAAMQRAGRPMALPPPVPFATGNVAPSRSPPASTAPPASQAQPGQPQSLLPP
ncbi:DUF2155 domain-containing protein [Gluconacetobacter sp. Hr-1-5]|uniref:DUF2155 domain-containing protein n=1 Tax=Gluconacetobacter sp. Hr-1-5 TaxID=3395370 RepID=UPI003B52EAF1